MTLFECMSSYIEPKLIDKLPDDTESSNGIDIFQKYFHQFLFFCLTSPHSVFWVAKKWGKKVCAININMLTKKPVLNDTKINYIQRRIKSKILVY